MKKGQHLTDTPISWEDSQCLRRIRKALGWKQLDLAVHLGLDEKTIWNIEKGTLQNRRAQVSQAVKDFIAKHSSLDCGEAG